MASQLVVSVVDLLRRPGSERTIECAAALVELGVDDDRFSAGAAVDVRLRLESLTDGVVVDGLLQVPWKGVCRRCLVPVEGTTEAEVHELYQRTLTDPDAFELTGDQIDLRPLVREVALLDAPDSPLCRADCAGLCPVCGVDRNLTACACVVDATDPRWSALGDWRNDE